MSCQHIYTVINSNIYTSSHTEFSSAFNWEDTAQWNPLMPLQIRAKWGLLTKERGRKQFFSWGVRRPQLPHTVPLTGNSCRSAYHSSLPATQPCCLFFQGHGGDRIVGLDWLFWHLPAHCICIFLLCWMLIQYMPTKWPQHTGLLPWSGTSFLGGAFHLQCCIFSCFAQPGLNSTWGKLIPFSPISNSLPLASNASRASGLYLLLTLGSRSLTGITSSSCFWVCEKLWGFWAVHPYVTPYNCHFSCVHHVLISPTCSWEHPCRHTFLVTSNSSHRITALMLCQLPWALGTELIIPRSQGLVYVSNEGGS